jgi:hypothetical protein
MSRAQELREEIARCQHELDQIQAHCEHDVKSTISLDWGRLVEDFRCVKCDRWFSTVQRPPHWKPLQSETPA